MVQLLIACLLIAATLSTFALEDCEVRRDRWETSMQRPARPLNPIVMTFAEVPLFPVVILQVARGTAHWIWLTATTDVASNARGFTGEASPH